MNYRKQNMYYNRELSWISFNKRVLSEASDDSTKLFERLKFLSITSSNLDEFFMVRVASLKDMVNAKYEKPDISGLTPVQQLSEISKEVHNLVKLQYETLRKVVLPKLEEEGVVFVNGYDELTREDKSTVDKYFNTNIYPVLTPIIFNNLKTFPLIKNKSLNIGVVLKQKKSKDSKKMFATVQIPSIIPRFIILPREKYSSKRIVMIEDVIKHNLKHLFNSYDIVDSSVYRITRNAGLTLDEDDASDLLYEIKKELKKRESGEVIRLEIEKGSNKNLFKFLKSKLKVGSANTYEIKGPIDLTFLMKVYKLDGYDKLKEQPIVPYDCINFYPTNGNIFEDIAHRDQLYCHPYTNFDQVVSFVESAANDTSVLAIKQTLYRVSNDSRIIKALITAAENGKEVTAVVELKARFDEENNIEWANKLEKAGCHVIYGIPGLKIHSKITLVVRKEGSGIVNYVHLGTGNYNESTAKLYTDIGLITCDKKIGNDVAKIFNYLSGNSKPEKLEKLSIAPISLREKFVKLIKRERDNAKSGKPSHIIAKMNSLCDPDMIDELYKASKDGVKIDLIVRGICCIKAGVPGVSENITVKSIVGNFLEHSRIFYFQNNDKPEVYCSSSDLMPRNLDRRVEVLFPICGTRDHVNTIIAFLNLYLNDNVNSHYMMNNGFYCKSVHYEGFDDTVNSQDIDKIIECYANSRILCTNFSKVIMQ